MKNLKHCLLTLIFLSITTLVFSQTIYYVKENGAGTQDGSSWANAFATVQAALDATAAAPAPDDEIWVAAGTYYPTDGTDRSISFVMQNNLAIRGGFAGTEAATDDLSQRDFVTNETILSGDIDKNDQTNFVNNDNNSFNIILNNGLNATAVLDGVTITGGNANGSGNTTGGGMFNVSSSPKIANCIFSNNFGSASGGGMFNHNNSSPTITNCIFMNNTALNGDSSGGGISNSSSSPIITNCIFADNKSNSGGGMSNEFNSNSTLINCTFFGNSSVIGLSGSSLGGGVFNSSSSPTLTNCTFEGNNTQDNGGGMYNRFNSNPTLTNCIIWNNKDDSGTGTANASILNSSSSTFTANYSLIQGYDNSNIPTGSDNLDGTNPSNDPKFVQSTDFSDPNIAPNLRLQSTSPAKNAGTISSYTGNGPAVGIFTDLDGNQRIRDCAIDLGAYEVQDGSTLGPILYVNAAATAGGDGSSWGNAYQDLQDALAVAPTCDGILEIWVAAGTYYPSQQVDGDNNGPETLEETFVMQNDLAIYGGFPNTGTPTPADRDWVAHPTILSGDINQDNALSGNSVHVIYNNFPQTNPLTASAVLDGFTIAGGNGVGNDDNDDGAGMFNRFSSPTIRNCTFAGNSSNRLGGGCSTVPGAILR